ncbi:MAG: hypothetical protein P8099_09190 [Gemmatimonadota bacterium]|jgi:hypothetical protein
MRRTVLLLAVSSAALLAGCSGQVDVKAQLQNNDQVTPINDMEVWLLPYDRDQIFDSLAAAYSTPEPTYPDSVKALQDSVIAAQRQWQEAQAKWNQARDSLQGISDKMKGMSRASGEYVALFRDFNDLDPIEKRLRAESDDLFKQFTGLQSRFSDESQEITAQRQSWSDEAFASVDSIMDARVQDIGRDPIADTTGDNGLAQFKAKAGQWWVYARHELPFTELYWNVPVTVKHGNPVQLILNRDNAQNRQKY